jgi:hypothetical protein
MATIDRNLKVVGTLSRSKGAYLQVAARAITHFILRLAQPCCSAYGRATGLPARLSQICLLRPKARQPVQPISPRFRPGPLLPEYVVGLDVGFCHRGIVSSSKRYTSTMDPISALSLAANVLQFVHFTAGLLNSAHKICIVF